MSHEIQAGVADRNAGVPQDERIEFRMSLNVGDVVVEDGDIFGDGVNVRGGGHRLVLTEFAADSLLEGDGFELPLPGRETAGW